MLITNRHDESVDKISSIMSISDVLKSASIDIPYIPELLNILQEINVSNDDDLIDYLSLIVIVSCIAWIAKCEKDKIIYSNISLLNAIVFSLKSHFMPLSVDLFIRVVDATLANISKNEELPPLDIINDFVMQTHSIQFIELFISRLISKGLTPVDSYFSQFLAAVAFISIQTPNFMNEKSAENIISLLSNYIIQIQPPAFHLFCIISKSVSDSFTSSIVDIIAFNLVKSVLKEKNIEIPTIEGLCPPNEIPGHLLELSFSIEHINLIDFPNGTNNKKTEFPAIEDLAKYFNCSEKISLFTKNLCENSKLFDLFIRSFLKLTEKPESDDAYFVALSIIFCLEHKILKYKIPVKLTKEIYVNKLFIPANCNIFETKSKFNYINTLRHYAIELMLFDENQEIIQNVLEDMIKYPQLFSEFVLRLMSFQESFIERMIKNQSLIAVLLRAGNIYQNIHFRKQFNEQIIENVRSILSSLYSYIFTNDIIIDLLFQNLETTKIFLLFMYEPYNESFVIQTYYQYILNSNQSKDHKILLKVLFQMINEFINMIPNDNAINVLTDLICSIINLSAHRIKLNEEKIKKCCLHLCSSLTKLEKNQLSYDCVRYSLSFLATLSQFFQISELELESLLYTLNSFNDIDFVNSVFINIVQLLAGECFSTLTYNFIIKHPMILKLLIGLYKNTEKFKEVIDLIFLVCHYSQKNILICCDVHIDLFIISCLENSKNENSNEKNVKLLLSLFSYITTFNTDMKTVYRYISLLSPIDNYNHVSIYQPLYISTLCNIANEALKEPLKYFPLDGSVFTSAQTVFDGIENGFTFSCWLFVEKNSSDYQPNLFTITSNCGILISSLISGTECFGLSDDTKKEVRGRILANVPISQWFFFVVNVVISPNIIEFIFSINCGDVSSFRITNLEFEVPPNSKISYSIGGGSIPPDCSIGKMAAVGLFPLLNKDQTRTLYNLGLSRDEALKSIIPYEYLSSFGNYGKLSNTKFLTILNEKCSINTLLPLFYFPKPSFIIDESPFQDQLDLSLELFSILLQFSVEVQLQFCKTNGFDIITHLITKKWISQYKYKTYIKFYNMLASAKCIELQRKIFQLILINFDILCQLEGELHLRILKHWEQTLLPCFLGISKDIYSFTQILSIMRMYYWYRPFEEEIIICKTRESFNVDRCRQKLHNILIKYSEDGLLLQEFVSIVSHCVGCQDDEQIVDLLTFLVNLIDNFGMNFKFICGCTEMNRYLIALLRLKPTRAHVFAMNILLSLRRQNLVTAEFVSDFLESAILVLPVNAFSDDLFQYCLYNLIAFPELLPFCVELATTIGEKTIEKLIVRINEKNDMFWLTLILYNASIEQQRKLIKCMIKTQENEWIKQFLYISFLYHQESDNFRSTFLEALAEAITDGVLIATPDVITAFFHLSEFYIFFRPSQLKNQALYALFDTYDSSSDADTNNPQQRKRSKSKESNFSYHEWNKNMAEQKNGTIPTFNFGLRFDINGNWIDSSLAKKCISIFIEYSAIEHIQFILMLISYLYRSGEKEVFLYLHSIHLTEKERSELNDYIQMVIYSSKMSGKSQFFVEKMNSLSTSLDAIYSDLVTKTNSIIFINKINEINAILHTDAQRRSSFAKSILHFNITRFSIKATQQDSIYGLKHEQSLQNMKESWERLWFFVSSDRAPWCNTIIEKLEYVRDTNTCFGFVPMKYAKIDQIQVHGSSVYKSPKTLFEVQCNVLFPTESFKAIFELTSELILLRFQKLKSFIVSLNTITNIYIRNENSIQIMTLTGETIYINFPELHVSKVLSALESVQMKNLEAFPKFGFSTFFKKHQKQTELWLNYKLSNYEYLLFLNNISGRSFNDLNNYPIFPWLIDPNTHLNRNLQTTISGGNNYSSKPPMNNDVAFHYFSSVFSPIDFSKKENQLLLEYETTPDMYSIIELSHISEVFQLRKFLESEEVSLKLHHWITLIWSSDKSCTDVIPLFSGVHKRRHKKRNAFNNSQIYTFDSKINTEQNDMKTLINCSTIKEINTREYKVKMITNEGVIYDSIIKNGEQTIIQTSNINNNSIHINNSSYIQNDTDPFDFIVSISANEHHFAAIRYNTSIIHILDEINSTVNVSEIDTFHEISCIDADGHFLAVGSSDSYITVYFDLRPIISSIIYRDEITAISVSATSHAIICGTKDHSIVFCSLISGNIVQSVQIFPLSPKKIVVSPSWGFVTVYCEEIEPGCIKKYLLLLSLNGQIIKKIEINFTVEKMYCWKSNDCFDIIALSSVDGCVYVAENLHLENMKMFFEGTTPIIAFYVTDETQSVVTAREDGSLMILPLLNIY